MLDGSSARAKARCCASPTVSHPCDTTDSVLETATTSPPKPPTVAIPQCPAADSVSHTDHDFLDHDRIAIPQVRITLHAQAVLKTSRDAW
jgi:hypothetical protein